MQVGSTRSGHAWRNTRFAVFVGLLAAAVVWLASQLILDTATGNTLSRIDVALAAFAFLVALGVALWLWRNPTSGRAQAMSTPALRQALATHQAGHVVAAYLNDPSRLGRLDTSHPCNLHPSPAPAITESALRGEMAITLAGITCEEVFAGETGRHAAGDLALATELGADMVGSFGMSSSMVSLGTSRPRRARFIERVLDDARTRKELESLLREVKRDTMRTMLENRHLIIAVRDALMRRHRLDAGEAQGILKSAEKNRHTADDEVLVDLRIVGNRPAAGGSA